MRRALRVIIPLGLLACFAAAAAFDGLLRVPDLGLFRVISWTAPSAPTDAAPGKQAAIPASRASTQPSASPMAQLSPATTQGAKIEVARIDPDGASVIAGRAPGGSKVTVHANGEAIAEVTASEDGQWSAIVTKGFAPGPVELAITAGAQETTSARSPVLAVEVPKGRGLVQLATAPAVPRPILPRRTLPGDEHAIPELAALLGKAKTIKSAEAAAEIAPVPITFVTGEATMTAHGQLAAGLLAEYVRIMAPKGITLSGHADERGSDEFNVELSRQRLTVIERHLRSQGYAGRLSLMPKGKSEPFGGIDRRAIPVDRLLQVDRRVELRSTE